MASLKPASSQTNSLKSAYGHTDTSNVATPLASGNTKQEKPCSPSSLDDFGIKYSSPDDANHLLNLLRADYEAVTVDWDASLYCGISFKWDYTRQTCDMSMPGYIPAALAKY
jgi:hypothetical protein